MVHCRFGNGLFPTFHCWYSSNFRAFGRLFWCALPMGCRSTSNRGMFSSLRGCRYEFRLFIPFITFVQLTIVDNLASSSLPPPIFFSIEFCWFVTNAKALFPRRFQGLWTFIYWTGTFLFDDLHTVFFFVSFLVMPTRARALPLPREDVLLVRRGSSTGPLFLRSIA